MFRNSERFMLKISDILDYLFKKSEFLATLGVTYTPSSSWLVQSADVPLCAAVPTAP